MGTAARWPTLTFSPLPHLTFPRPALPQATGAAVDPPLTLPLGYNMSVVLTIDLPAGAPNATYFEEQTIGFPFSATGSSCEPGVTCSRQTRSKSVTRPTTSLSVCVDSGSPDAKRCWFCNTVRR